MLASDVCDRITDIVSVSQEQSIVRVDQQVSLPRAFEGIASRIALAKSRVGNSLALDFAENQRASKNLQCEALASKDVYEVRIEQLIKENVDLKNALEELAALKNHEVEEAQDHARLLDESLKTVKEQLSEAKAIISFYKKAFEEIEIPYSKAAHSSFASIKHVGRNETFVVCDRWFVILKAIDSFEVTLEEKANAWVALQSRQKGRENGQILKTELEEKIKALISEFRLKIPTVSKDKHDCLKSDAFFKFNRFYKDQKRKISS